MDININLMKEIFGSMPLDHLSAAQALATNNRNRNLIIFGFVVVGVAGAIIGYKISENKNKFVAKPKDPKDTSTRRPYSSSGKFRSQGANNFSARPIGIKKVREENSDETK